MGTNSPMGVQCASTLLSMPLWEVFRRWVLPKHFEHLFQVCPLLVSDVGSTAVLGVVFIKIFVRAQFISGFLRFQK